MRQRLRVASPALCACLGLAAASPEPTPPEFGSTINVVSLPIFVADAHGQAVAGLTAEDFEVLDDGRRVPLVGFTQIDAAGALPDAAAAQSPAARRQFLLLFDVSFTGTAGLMRGREAARRFVEELLEPRDLAAVATLSANHGVRLLVGFTSDRVQLQRAIETLGVLRAGRLADPLGLVYDLREVGSAHADEVAADEAGRTALLDETARLIRLRFQQAEKADYRQRTRGFLAGLADLARALDGVQGRKQVVLLSSGFDATPLIGQAPQESFQASEALNRGRFWEVRTEDRFGDAELRAELERSLRAFSRSDAVIHSVDVSGLTARGDSRFQSGEPTQGSGQEALARIADLAGGRLFKAANDLRPAFDDILALSRHYYLAAFEPQAARGPGKFHKLQVRVKRKGHRVSHRGGYFEREPYQSRTELTRQFEAAELVASGVTGGALELRALALPYRDTAGRITLPVVLEVDGPSLLGAAPRKTLGLEVYGYALDAHERVQDFLAFTASFETARIEDRLRNRGLQCHAVFTLPPGRHQLRFLVRDPDDGRTGVHWLEVNVPSFAAAGVLLFPPLFMDAPEDWVLVEARSRSTHAAVSPFRVGERGFAPRPRPALRNGTTASVVLLAFDGGARYDPGASFEIQPRVLAAGGSAVSVGGFRLESSSAEADGFRRFVLSFTPRDLQPGDYTLRVGLRDPASGRVSEAFQTMVVQ